ncbi:MAG TPA: pantoate--beta-alanine ligase [Flavobacteriales bacterium]|nr:pantoate--beta-alanine ligase [Flavobacteriales bacterium]
MKIFHQKTELKSYLNKNRDEKTISFVPTMGALHDGHLSLIKNAKDNSDIVVCSIFINPTQFNDPKDLEKYPVTTEKDIQLLISENCDVLYLPEVSDLYSENEKTKHFEFNGLDNFMEGAGRKGHFNGVATIVEKLFRIVNPDIALFGEKDLQQLQIIKYITKQLDLPIIIIGVPTKREVSGLAMSSRNKLLSVTDKQIATIINETLLFIKENSDKYTLEEIKQISVDKLNKNTDLEYLEIVDLETLSPISEFQGKNKNAACIAASISSVRLIDNIIF